jgi:hypothetical protein
MRENMVPEYEIALRSTGTVVRADFLIAFLIALVATLLFDISFNS